MKYLFLLAALIFVENSAISATSEVKPDFTVDWSGAFINNFGRLKGKIRTPAKVLEIGSYEGRSTLHMAKNMDGATIHALDTWEGSMENPSSAVAGLYERFMKNLDPYIKSGKVVPFKGSSRELLPPMLVPEKMTYDFIYIDGSHQAVDVLQDAVLSWQLLKVGGIMAFDDYKWMLYKEPHLRPGPAINAMLTCFQTKYELLEKGRQVWIRKTEE